MKPPDGPVEIPARLRAWIECPTCGRVDTPTKAFNLPAGPQAAGDTLKVRITCDRCGNEGAMVFLVRELVQ
jgi:ribosomal protein S27E